MIQHFRTPLLYPSKMNGFVMILNDNVKIMVKLLL